MTRNKAHNSVKYVFKEGEPILVDANVWLYLQPPASQPVPHFARHYSAAMKNLITAKAKAIIDCLVLSEYINRYVRIEYDAVYRGTYPKYKDFRTSPDFALVAKSAVAEAKHILSLAAAEDTSLSQVNVMDILNETEAGTLDFNDGMLVEMCRLRGWKVLTNDADMQLGGIEVLTTNPKLLAACP